MSGHTLDEEAAYRFRARMLTMTTVQSMAAPAVPVQVDPERTRPGNDLPYESHHSSFDRKIVLVTAAFLLLLLALLLLHILVRCIMRRLYHPPHDPTISDQHTPHPMKKRQIQSLPSSTFHYSSTHEMPTNCPICLADFSEGDLIRLLPTCNHGFHASCVDSWFLRQATCPTCRADLLKGEERSRSLEVHVVIMPTGELCPPTLSSEAKDHSCA